jgi:hypothetical protein
MEKYRVLLKDIKDAYFEVDLSVISPSSQRDVQCSGIRTEELIGSKYRKLVDKDGAKKLQQAVERLHKNDEPVNLMDMEAAKKTERKNLRGDGFRDQRNGRRGRGIQRGRPGCDPPPEMEAELKRNQHDLIRKNQEIDQSRKDIQQALVSLEKAHEELKASQLKILQQEKMASIGQLAAGVAHELNNPMSFISSNLSTLEKYINRLIQFIRVQSEAVASLQDAAVVRRVDEKRAEVKLDYMVEDVRTAERISGGGATGQKNCLLTQLLFPHG